MDDAVLKLWQNSAFSGKLLDGTGKCTNLSVCMCVLVCVWVLACKVLNCRGRLRYVIDRWRKITVHQRSYVTVDNKR